MRREDRFERLYTLHYPSIHAFVHRRSSEMGSDVGDVVAEVFAVAWRRLDELPAPPEDRLWLDGVARRCVGRARRSDWRLGRAEREAVQLVMWEGLTHEAGRVLGCSANAVALRLHKARKRLQAELEPAPDPALPSGHGAKR